VCLRLVHGDLKSYLKVQTPSQDHPCPSQGSDTHKCTELSPKGDACDDCQEATRQHKMSNSNVRRIVCFRINDKAMTAKHVECTILRLVSCLWCSHIHKKASLVLNNSRVLFFLLRFLCAPAALPPITRSSSGQLLHHRPCSQLTFTSAVL
jgi:hypothetical protein